MICYGVKISIIHPWTLGDIIVRTRDIRPDTRTVIHVYCITKVLDRAPPSLNSQIAIGPSCKLPQLINHCKLVSQRESSVDVILACFIAARLLRCRMRLKMHAITTKTRSPPTTEQTIMMILFFVNHVPESPRGSDFGFSHLPLKHRLPSPQGVPSRSSSPVSDGHSCSLISSTGRQFSLQLLLSQCFMISLSAGNRCWHCRSREVHTPEAHAKLATRCSSQASPSGCMTSSGHVVEFPSHNSSGSQAPLLPRQTKPLDAGWH